MYNPDPEPVSQCKYQYIKHLSTTHTNILSEKHSINKELTASTWTNENDDESFSLY
jgi:hypothetical protein